MNIMSQKRKILIVGGGFGGIKTALELCDDERFDITLLSERYHFRYYPTLWRAATGGNLGASKIMLKNIFEDKPVNIKKGVAEKLDRTKHQIITEDGKKYSYDELILSVGVVTNYFGIKGLKKYAYGIKSVEEAERLRKHLHKSLVSGDSESNYVIIGGGPTGVELAGALPGYLNHIIRAHNLPQRELHIDLVEAAPRLVPRMPQSYSHAIAKRLRSLGVKLFLGQTVSAETADKLKLSGHSIDSHTVIWTAGVASNPFYAANKFIMGGHGKVSVDKNLSAEDNVYVLGDNADTPYSGMAQTALYDAKFVAANLKRLADGSRPRIYEPKLPVYITPCGYGWAAVLWGKFGTFGKLGWWLRSAADYAGYHDYQPWWKASQLLLEEAHETDECKICAQA